VWWHGALGPLALAGSGLLAHSRINKFGRRNLMDSVPSNFKIGDFIIYGFKIFEKIIKYM
jgi:hypothetical protein